MKLLQWFGIGMIYVFSVLMIFALAAGILRFLFDLWRLDPILVFIGLAFVAVCILVGRWKCPAP